MAFTYDELRVAGAQTVTAKSESLTEARKAGRKTAFLSHSHHDADKAKGVVVLLRRAGWDVYVDWADSSMPETTNKETAAKIKQKITSSDLFLFLATHNSMSSRWCPWEIGFADSSKGPSKVLIIPTADSSGKYYGNEYLQLYKKIDKAQGGDLGVWEPGAENGSWLKHFTP